MDATHVQSFSNCLMPRLYHLYCTLLKSGAIEKINKLQGDPKWHDIWWAGQVPTVHRSSCKMYSVLVSCAKAACFTVLKDGLPIAVNFTREGAWKLGNLCQVFTVQMWLWLCVVVWGCRWWETFLERLQRTLEAKLHPGLVFSPFTEYTLWNVSLL